MTYQTKKHRIQFVTDQVIMYQQFDRNPILRPYVPSHQMR